MIWYWTDHRLAGWDEDKPLPDTLWGPHIVCVNSRSDFKSEQTQFDLVDPITGRIKRGHMFHGCVDNEMDVSDFPFDTDDLRLTFEAVGHWISKDGTKSGTLAYGVSYILQPVVEPSEGRLMSVYWNGKIPEFQLLGCSILFNKLPPSPQGSVRQLCILNVHVARRSSFFWFKIMLPLYMLVILSFSVFAQGNDGIADRNTVVATYFLAANAMLYVLSGYLPTTDYLTRIDKSIFATLTLMMAIGIESVTIYWISHRFQWDSELTTLIDLSVALTLAIMYVTTNLVIFLPPYWRHTAAVVKLSTPRDLLRLTEIDELPGVGPDVTYIPLSQLISGRQAGHRLSGASRTNRTAEKYMV